MTKIATRASLLASGDIVPSGDVVSHTTDVLRFARSHAPRLHNDVTRAKAKRALAILELAVARESKQVH